MMTFILSAFLTSLLWSQWWGRCSVWEAVRRAVETGVSDAAAGWTQRLWPTRRFLPGLAGGDKNTHTHTLRLYKVCSVQLAEKVTAVNVSSLPCVSCRGWQTGQLQQMQRKMNRSWMCQPWHSWRWSSSCLVELQGEARDSFCFRHWPWWLSLCSILCCWEKSHRWVQRYVPLRRSRVHKTIDFWCSVDCPHCIKSH